MNFGYMSVIHGTLNLKNPKYKSQKLHLAKAEASRLPEQK